MRERGRCTRVKQNTTEITLLTLATRTDFGCRDLFTIFSTANGALYRPVQALLDADCASCGESVTCAPAAAPPHVIYAAVSAVPTSA